MGDITKIAVTGNGEVVRALAELLSKHLVSGKRVLWLVSGGSSLPVAAAASHRLPADTSKLCVMLVDDRLEPYGSSLTNWQQLINMGFQAGKSSAVPIVQPRAQSLAKTAADYEAALAKQLAGCDVRIGQFGLGEGHHTGGILPRTPAAREVTKLVVGYEHGGIGRVTITPAVMKQLDIAFINSMGETKRPLVQRFLQSSATIEDEPTQALRLAGQTLLYSDVI